MRGRPRDSFVSGLPLSVAYRLSRCTLEALSTTKAQTGVFNSHDRTISTGAILI